MYYTLQKVLQMTLEQETRIENKKNGLKLKKIMQEKKTNGIHYTFRVLFSFTFCTF